MPLCTTNGPFKTVTPKNQNMKFLKSIALIAALTTLTLQSCKKEATADSTTTATDSTAIAPPPPPPPPMPEKMCFLRAINKDSTTVSLIINGTEVSGEMIWNPYQKDGATGTLTGTKAENGEMNLMYNYMIEGNKQSETKIMKIENGTLMIKKGELLDPKNDGNMVYKDASKAKFTETLTKTTCK